MKEFFLINKYHVSMLPYFLDKLKSIQEGDSNLLDKTLIMYGSPMGDSQPAQPSALPADPAWRRERQAGRQPAPEGAGRHADGERDAERRCTRSAWTT